MIIYVYTFKILDQEYIGRGLAEAKDNVPEAIKNIKNSHDARFPDEPLTPLNYWVVPFDNGEEKARAIHDRELKRIESQRGPEQVGAEQKFEFPNQIFERSASNEVEEIEGEEIDPTQRAGIPGEPVRPIPPDRAPTFAPPTT